MEVAPIADVRARLVLAEDQLRRENGFVPTAAEALAQKAAIVGLVVGHEAKDAELTAARAEIAALGAENAAQAAENAAQAGEVAAQAARIAELEAAK